MATPEEQLRCQLEASEKEKQEMKRAHEQEIALKDQKIALKDQEIALRDQENKRLKRTIVEKDQRLDSTTIKALWVNEDKLNLTITKMGGTLKDSHVDHKRPKATAQKATFLLAQRKLDDTTLETPSALLGVFKEIQGRRVMTYSNEDMVQGFVQNALQDVVFILNELLGGNNLLTVQTEASIFSNKPDHVVVCIGPLQTPLLYVETKQPFSDSEDEINEKVLGQVYDYNGILAVLGHSNPFVVLSTFDQSWVTWPKSNKVCKGLALNVEDRFTPLDQLAKHSSLLAKSETPSPLTRQGTLVRRSLRLATSTPQTRYGNPVRQSGRPENRQARELCISQPYDSNQLVKLLVNAISCSLHNFQGSPPKDWSQEGYNLQNKPVLTMTEQEYYFENIRLRVVPGKDLSFVNSLWKPKFHILAMVGSGRTSKAFLATTSTTSTTSTSTTEGHECVLKMYVRKYDENENYKRIDSTEFAKNAATSIAKEKEMYGLIYKMETPVVTLNHHECLLLPYFRPVEKAEREEALQELVVVLQQFRVDEEGTTTFYKFREEDQRWRHCGYRVTENQPKSLIVFDLADLETCATEKEHETYIEEHIEKLRSRIPAAQVEDRSTNVNDTPHHT